MASHRSMKFGVLPWWYVEELWKGFSCKSWVQESTLMRPCECGHEGWSDWEINDSANPGSTEKSRERKKSQKGNVKRDQNRMEWSEVVTDGKRYDTSQKNKRLPTYGASTVVPGTFPICATVLSELFLASWLQCEVGWGPAKPREKRQTWMLLAGKQSFALSPRKLHFVPSFFSKVNCSRDRTPKIPPHKRKKLWKAADQQRCVAHENLRFFFQSENSEDELPWDRC